MSRAILVYWVSMLLFIGLDAQTPLLETTSNFVNFNLNRVNQVRAYLRHYNGRGLTASIKEFQFDTLDIDFTGRYLPHAQAANQTNAHATLMATILGGGGNSFRNGLGVAWGAHLTSSSFLNIFPDDNSYFEELGIRVQNHAYGIDSIENYYGPIAAAYDLQVSRMPDLLHVFSVGNLGMQTPDAGPYAGISGYSNISGEFKLAKNVLTVGVVDSFGIIDPFSSHGPAFDGRIKPDLVAFGIGGSSAAAALASGAALLLQQAYLEIKGHWPAAALLKTLLVNGAQDVGPEGVDHIYGFGNIDIYRSLQTLLAGHYLTDTLAFEQTQTHTIIVPEAVRALKITLGWTDPPAAVNAEKALVNDLDLQLIREPDKQVWLPQRLHSFPHLDSLALPAGIGEDHINNLEQIVVQDPLPGTYQVVVKAYDFGVSEQIYELAYSWDTLQTFRWLFPARNDRIVPSDKFYEQLYWESALAEESGILSYSFDGANWQTINTTVNLATGSQAWFPPDTVAQALLRMQIGTDYFVSDTFIVGTQPFLDVVLNCPDSIGLSWPSQAGIDQYRLYRLETEYLQPFLNTSDTFVIIPKRDLLNPFIALAPVLKNGVTGVRSLAYNTEQQAANCYEQFFFGEVVGTAGHLYLDLGTAYGVSALVLERQIGGQFTERQRINSINGKSVEFIDQDLEAGPNTYRVKILLQNESFVYSSLVELFYIEPDRFVIYPNPISRQGSFQVLHNVVQAEKVSFQLFTALGASVVSLTLSDLENALFADDLQSGMYFYRFVRDGKLLQSGKLVVR